jgi:hypothetical protein
MLTEIDVHSEGLRNARLEKRLWNCRDRYSLSLGCTSCPDRTVCGGLQLENTPFDCLGFCCGKPNDCDAVCRNKPEEFAQRVREIGGFSLTNVPRAPLLQAPLLPALIPIMFHGDKRHSTFCESRMVSLPLYKVISRHDGSVRYGSPEALAEGFGIGRDTSVLLTGTAIDPPLERWWSLGSDRRKAIRALIGLKVSMVTTPNFSLFTDQPRWDDMHSMKRIAIVHEEFLSEGLPAALHVNARTESDWERWSDYVKARPEVTHLAYEFGTGAGWGERIDWHADQLVRLANAVDRPLHLVVRGGTKVLSILAAAFAGLTVLDTSAFLKTMKRQRAIRNGNGAVDWKSCPTDATQMLDNLFAENWKTVVGCYPGLAGRFTPPLEAAG